MPSGLHQSKKLKIFGAILALSFVFTGAHPAFALEPTHTTDGSPIEHGVNLELSVAPTLQVVIPASTVSLNLTPNPDPSIPVFASSNLVVSVATNNPTGYSLMLKANSTNLTNTVADREGNYAILPTLVDQVGGYTEDSFTTNAWGYRNTNNLLNNIATTTIPGNYNAFTTSSEILSSKLPTNLDQTSLDFAAKVDITQPAGTYELALNFEAVTNVIPGVVTINYDPNAGSGEMSPQQIEAGTSQTLIPNTFTKEHYIFTGWNTAPDGTGTHYNNEQSYETVLDVANKSVTLYAQWELETYNIKLNMSNASSIVINNISYSTNSETISLAYGTYSITGTFPNTYQFSSWDTTAGNITDASVLNTIIEINNSGTITLIGEAINLLINATSLQTITAAQCSDTAVGQTASLKDTRDNETYLIGKLADGRCWMMDNLRLGSDSPILLTIDDTNIADSWTLPAGDSSSATSFTVPEIYTEMKNNTVTSWGDGSGRAGVYYNYCAMTAGTFCFAQGQATGNAKYDICPRGWRLPTGGPGGEQELLYTAYNNNAESLKEALSIALSGYFSYGALKVVNAQVGYLSSTSINNDRDTYSLMYSIEYGVSIMADADRNGRGTFRCIKK